MYCIIIMYHYVQNVFIFDHFILLNFYYNKIINLDYQSIANIFNF